MIIFLNFAPIEFMGGAERWMYETSNYVNQREKTLLISVSKNLSNIYAKIILKRDFNDRVKLAGKGSKKNYLYLKNFIPFSKSYRETQRKFKEARVIYLKYELLEVLIALYFGGNGVFSKVVAGLHSPFIYNSPNSFTDYLHNLIYQSFLSKLALRKIKAVHTITLRDTLFLNKQFKLNNVVFCPNSVNLDVFKLPSDKNSNKLNIIFVGELGYRKGVDILCKLIPKFSKNYKLRIVGNGPLLNKVKEVCINNKNCECLEYLQKSELQKIYQESDVLFLPSRAEGFPLVFHEAMANGLVIVDSKDIGCGLPNFIEYSVDNSKYLGYLRIFNKLFELKQDKKLKPLRKKILGYYAKNMSSKKVQPEIVSNFFKSP